MRSSGLSSGLATLFTKARRCLTRRRRSVRFSPLRFEQLEPRTLLSLSISGFSENQVVDPSQGGGGVVFDVSASGTSTPSDSFALHVYMSYTDWRTSGISHNGTYASWSPDTGGGDFAGVVGSPLVPPGASGAQLYMPLLGDSPDYHCAFSFGQLYWIGNGIYYPPVFTQPGTSAYVVAFVAHYGVDSTGHTIFQGYTDCVVTPFQINTEEVDLSFTQQPEYGWTLAANALPTFQVRALNASGYGVPNIPVTITAPPKSYGELVFNPGTLSGTTTVLTDALGFATFSDLSVDTAGRYQFAVSAPGAWTRNGNVLLVGVPGRVAFTQQPASGPPGQLAPVTVRVVDSQGSPIGGHWVTLALNSDNGATLSGTSGGLTDAWGCVTFNNLSIDRPGLDYTLTANVANSDRNIAPIPPVTSKPFDLEVLPLRVVASVDTVIPGGYVTYTITASVSQPADQFVLIDDLPAGTNLVPGTYGQGMVSVGPQGGTRITWNLAGDTAASASATVRVRRGADRPPELTTLVNSVHAEALVEGQTLQRDAHCTVALTRGLGVQLVPSTWATTPDGEIAFGIIVNAPAQAQSLEIQSLVPQGSTLVPGSVTDGGSVSDDSSRITWHLPAGTTAEPRFRVQVDPLDQLPADLSFLTGEATASAIVEGDTLDGSSQVKVCLVRGDFDWSMPERYGLDAAGNPTDVYGPFLTTGISNTILPNDYEYVHPNGYTLRLDATPLVCAQGIMAWDWTVKGDTGTSGEKTAQGIEPEIRNLRQGTYTVKLTITLADGSKTSMTQQVKLRDILIVAIGDSYSSGEGNPDFPVPIPGAASKEYALAGRMWANGDDDDMTKENAEAHRSTLAASSQAAYQIERSDPHTSVTFVMLSTSGSTWKQGFSGPAIAKETAWGTVPAQLPALKRILGTRKPDILTVSLGGNDIGFAEIVLKLLALSAQTSDDSASSIVDRWEAKAEILSKFQANLDQLSSSYAKLGAYLENVFHPKYVLQTNYPDFTIGSNKQPVAFGTDIDPIRYPGGIDQALSQWAHDRIHRALNYQVKLAVDWNAPHAEYGWQLVDVTPGFRENGYAATDTYFVTMTKSKEVQGTQWTEICGPVTLPYWVFSSGVLHPNWKGLARYKDLMVPLMEKDIAALLALPDLGLGTGDAPQPMSSGLSGGAVTADGTRSVPATLQSLSSEQPAGESPSIDATDHLVVTTQPPSSVPAATGLSLVVAAADGEGNVDTSFNGDVTVTDLSQTVGGATAVTAVNGVAAFSGLTINAAGRNRLFVSANGLHSAWTDEFTVKARSADVTDHLVVTMQPPSTVTAGTSFGLEVVAEARPGVVDTSFDGSVTIALADNASGGTLGGTLTVTAVEGVATFSDVTIDIAGSGYTLLAISDSLPAVATTTVDVTAAAAAQLVVTTQPPERVTIGTPFSLEVTAADACGNWDPTFDGFVTMTMGDNPEGAGLGGTLTVAMSRGVAAFTDLTLDWWGDGYTLQATADDLASGTTRALSVIPLEAATLVVINQPPDVLTAGEAFDLVFEARDGQGSVDVYFDGSVTLELAPNVFGATLGGTVTVAAQAGVAAFSGLSIDTAGSGYTLRATSHGLPVATTSAFDVIAAPATQLRVSSPVGEIVAGSPFGITVYAVDPQGNIDPRFNDSVGLAVLDNPGGATLGGPSIVTASGGVASFSGLTLDHGGSGYTLLAMTGALTDGMSAVFPVLNQLVVATAPPSTVTAGTAFRLVVWAADGSGAMDTSFNGNVTVGLRSATGDAANALKWTLTVAAVNGVATFSGLTVDRAGTYSLMVTGRGLEYTSQPLQVKPGSATQLVVTSQPSTMVTTDDLISLAVVAEDALGNVGSTFNGNVTVSLGDNPGDATLGGTLTALASSGRAVFGDLMIDQPGSDYTLQVTTPDLASDSTDAFTVVPVGMATRLVVTNQPPGSVTAGADFGFVVTAEDFKGNVATSFNGSVSITDPSGARGGTLTVTAVNGVATFSRLAIDVAASCYRVTATAGGLAGTITNCIAVTPAAATQLVVSVPVTITLTGAPFGLQVSAEDPYGNLDRYFNGPVTLALSANPGGASLGGTVTVTVVDGLATFTGLTIDKPGSGYGIEARSPGLTAGTGAPFDVMQDRLVVATQPPSSVTAGSSFGLVVRAEDGMGNVDTSFQDDVTVATQNGLGGPSGRVTATAVDGVATFSGLTIDQASVGNSLIATSDGLATAISNPFDVVCGTASQLAVVIPPPSHVSATDIFEVDVAVEDPLGNVQTAFQGDVTIVLADNPTGAALGGTHTVTAINGVAAFRNLTIDTPGDGYVLQVTSQGLTAVTSGIHVAPVGVATELVVTAQPPRTFAAGSGFGLVVTAEDGFGNVDTTFNGNVTVNDPADASLAGTLTVTAVNGVATFSGLTEEQAGSNKWLSVAGADVNSVATDSYTVTASEATHLAVWGPDRNVLPGSAFGVTVVAEDPYGNVDPTFTGSVTLALGTNPGNAELDGTVTATSVVGGTFHSDLTVDKPGAGYTIEAQSAGLTSGTSDTFDVTTDQLVVTSQPPRGLSTGAGFCLTVAAEDGSGHLDTAFAGDVTVALFDVGSTGARLNGTLSVKAVGGVAAFSGVSVDRAGDYALIVSSEAVGAAVTNLFTATTTVVANIWHNYANPYDVNGDGRVTPLDVLLIINCINAHPGSTAPPAPPAVPPPYYDVAGGASGEGDDLVTPLDVLVVINYINAHPPGASAGEAALTADSGDPALDSAAPTGEAESVAASRRSRPSTADRWWEPLEEVWLDLVDDIDQAWRT